MTIEFEPDQKRHHHSCKNGNAPKRRRRHGMFLSCIRPVKKLKSFYHKYYWWNKDQRKNKRHYVGKKSELEISKI